jgi:DNA polymerase-3 subunit alpha
MFAYWSAYLKCHHKKEFYKNWLATADGKLDPDAEKKELVLSARSDEINILGPHYKKTNDNFEWDYEDNGIRFGLCNIKNVGSIHTKTLKERLGAIGDNPAWLDILVNVLQDINKRAVENMISVGVFSGLKVSRTTMLHEFSCLSDLTDKELLLIKSLLPNKKTLIELISDFINRGLKKNGGLISTSSRLTKIEAIKMRLENPGRSLSDNPSVYSKLEESLLGCWVHQSELSASAEAVYADTTCLEITEGKLSKSTIAAIIRRIKVHKTQKGDDMCFLSVEDNSGELENIVIFTELYGQNKDIIYQDSTVLITGEIKDKERKSFIVESIFQI